MAIGNNYKLHYFDLIFIYLTLSLYLITITVTSADGTPRHLRSLGDKIFNGNPVKRREDYAYQLSFRTNGQHICGAVIIGEQSALTAAHCVVMDNDRNPNPSNYKVVAGGLDSSSSGTEPGEQVLKVLQIFVHPNYNVGKDQNLKDYYWENDIAYLRLEPMTLNDYVSYVLLPTWSTPSAPDWAYLSGWGKMVDEAGVAKRLQWAKLPLVPDDQCGSKYDRQQIKEDSMICAGGLIRNMGACQGDSGGPLVIKSADGVGRPTLIGIVSWQRGGCGSDYPGVFTRISKFVSWIEGIRSQLTASIHPRNINPPEPQQPFRQPQYYIPPPRYYYPQSYWQPYWTG